MNSHIERLASRVSDDATFLAPALAAYARSEGADDDTVAKKLRCKVNVLAPLRLCRMPRADAPLFSQDIDRIAERFRVDADVLAEMVRRGQVLMKTRRASHTATGGSLMAARDHEPSLRRKKGDNKE